MECAGFAWCGLSFRPGDGAEVTWRPQKMQQDVQDEDAAAGEVCREDLARVLVECLQHPPKKALVFQVQNRPQGDSPEDLTSQMSRLQEAVAV